MKKFITFVLVFTFILIMPIYSYYELYKLYKVADIINVNNKKINIDKPILQYNKDIYVPLDIMINTYNVSTRIDNHTLAIKSITNTEYLKTLLKDIQYSVYIQIVDDNGVLKSNASGIIVSKNILLTCYHVIDEVVNCANIKIIAENNILKDNNKYLKMKDNYKPEYDKYSFDVSEILYSNKDRDIAVLEIPETTITPVKLGDSDKLSLLDDIVTVSSPLGFFNTVTKGAISGFREYKGQKYIQTDASTKDGSSGGAIINTKGELIGIIECTLDQTNDINLSIPINEVKEILSNYI